MDLISLALRYVGRHVRISVHGHQKIEGILESVHDDCFRICGALTMDELDDQGWYSKLRESDPEFSYGPRDPETLVHVQSILAITCMDEDLEPPDVQGEHERHQTITNASEIIVVSDEDPIRDSEEEAWRRLLEVDRISLEIGPGLIGLAKDDGGDGLLNRITSGRKELADQIGLVAPLVRVRDNLQLQPHEYRICISDCEVARGIVRPDRQMALGGERIEFGIDGEPALEPVFGLPAYWIDASERRAAELAGWSVFDPQTIIVTHLLDVLKRHAPDLLTYEQVAELVRRFRVVAPQLVHEVVPAVVSLRTLHAILRRLLEERVSIRNVAGILECLGQEAGEREDAERLLAQTRIRLGREVCRSLRSRDSGAVRVIDFSKEINECARECLSAGGEAWLSQLAVHAKEQWSKFAESHGETAILVEPDLRKCIYELLNRRAPWVRRVLAHSEIPREQPVEVGCTISSDSLAAMDQSGGSPAVIPVRQTS